MNVLDSLKELRDVHETGVRFADNKGKLKYVPYGELVAQGQRFAASLLKHGVQRGEPVILVMTEPENAIIAILGCMIAGCPPAPVYPPLNLRAVPAFLNFIRHVVSRAGATFVVADAQPYSILGGVRRESPAVKGVEKFTSIIHSHALEPIESEGKEIAFLQFTSGSTSAPKGVMVMHDGLAANLQMIRESSRMDRNSCVVTWLPVYHDMGLIGTVLNAITLPCSLVVLPPIVFLKKPRLWLELITQFHGTHTAAPNFAYGLCVKRVPDTTGLDLSSMTTFICGAEPVIPATMENFVRHYQSAGLRPGALVPAYGLAEATLAVTFSPHMRGLAAETVSLDTLTAGRIAKRVEGAGQHSIRVSSCGVPMPGLSVRIAGEDGTLLSERRIGEVQMMGPSVTPGYVGDEEATRQSRTPDGWLRTGDLGYIADGELHPCGRMKDVIIIRGKNFHAHDLESLASEVPGVRTGNVVAFSVQEQEGESLVLVAETREEGRGHEISRMVRSHLADSIGVTPDEVMAVAPGTLPKTSSGKLKRAETKSLYVRKELGIKPSVLSLLTTFFKSRFTN